MVNSPLEFLAERYGNVVKYDRDGNPSIFVKFPKMKSRDLDASLPDHTHPAFIINGEEQDYILLGKYKASSLIGAEDGSAYSLPNMIPETTADGIAKCRAFDETSSAMTAADYGLMLLMAHKLGWNPQGNTQSGYYIEDATPWDTGIDVRAKARYGYLGWVYECITDHRTSAQNAPDHCPLFWKRIMQIGGDADNTGVTRTGTGPMEWYLDGTLASMADIVGNVQEFVAGYRVVAGELQILENNNAAAHDADVSAGSSAWKAILPNAADDSYTLVAPGTAGTLHWKWSSNKLTLDIAASTLDGQTRKTAFADLAVNTATVPHVPSIVRELGLFPVSGSTAKGTVSVKFQQGEIIFGHGGDCGSGESAGIAAMEAHQRTDMLGVRTRYQEG